MPSRRLLRLRHDRTDLGFLSAGVAQEDGGSDSGWILRVEEPSTVQEFPDHLSDGSSMTLSMTTRAA
jgi:hypothetical protein